MGNLSNLYISQSFQSLIHLGSDSNATTNLTLLQDGLGNSIGVGVNTAGDLFLSGSLTASLQQGYVYVGNASGKTSAFATASLVTNINTGSLTSTASFNAYTQSNNQRVSSLETNSASVNTSITNLNASSASQQVSINSLNAATQSYVTETESGSFLITASFNDGTRNLTFTKGNNTTFNVNIPAVSGSSTIDTGSLVTTASFNAYTQSNDQRVASLENNSASVNISITNLNSKTGSYATTGSNTFVDNQNINAQLVVDTAGNQLLLKSGANGTTVFNQQPSGSPYNGVLSIFQTQGASGIDIQPNVNITGNLTASAARISNLNYPTADNGAKSFIQTDGAGNLSLQYVDTIWESVRAGENVVKGTPLYISGSQGANPIVYAADASNPAKMPVTFIAGDAYTAGTTYPAIVLGLIEGLDLTGYTSGQTVYVAEGGGWSTSLPSGSSSITQVLGVVTKGGSGGKGLVLNPGPAQLPGLDTGKMWVGNGNNQPIEITTASFATTGSNTFQGNQIISGNVAIAGTLTAYSASFISVTSSVIIGGNTILLNTFTPAVRYGGIEVIDSGSTGLTGSMLWDSQNDVWIYVNPSGSSYVSARLISGPKSLTLGSEPTLTQNRIPKADDGDHLVDSQISDDGTTVTVTNAFSASTFVGLGNLSSYSASVDSKITELTSKTGSYATTGSNTFVGNQLISGSLIQSSSNSIIADPIGQGVGTWIKNRVLISDVSGAAAPRLFISGSDGAYSEFGRGFINQDTRKVPGLGASIYTGGPTDSNGNNTVAVANDDYSVDVELQMFANTSSVGLADWDNVTAFNYVPFMTLAPNLGDNPAPQFKRSVGITGSLDLSSTLTASLQNGYVWVGNASGRTTTVPTSSFGGGSAGFPFTGSAQITGSLGVTGSLSGFVNDLAIVANTASMNFNDGNFFTLQLVSGSITHLTATNIRPGQTINLLVKMGTSPTAASTGSLTFSPAFKFAGGFDYTPTTITGSQDLVSFVTFDTTQILAAQVKNLS